MTARANQGLSGQVEQLDVLMQAVTGSLWFLVSALHVSPHSVTLGTGAPGERWKCRTLGSKEEPDVRPTKDTQASRGEPATPKGPIFRVHDSLPPPQIFCYYHLDTALALFLKSAALKQFCLTSAGCQQLCLKTRITKSSKE